jgi:hypothetical protein
LLKKKVSIVTAPAIASRMAMVEAHQIMLDQWRSRPIASFLKAIFADMRRWLDADDEKPARFGATGNVLYPVERALARIEHISRLRS